MNKKNIGLIVGGIILCGIFIFGSFTIGKSQAQAELDGTMVTIKEAQSKKDSLNTEISKSEDTLADLKKDSDTKRDELEQLSDELSETKKIIETKDSLNDDLSKLENDIKTKKETISDLDSNISDKNKQVEKLENGIIVLKKEPKNLPAGQFTVGNDIDAGRYRVTSNGGSGNFFINDGMDANVMLGKEDYFVDEYITYLNEGDEIDQSIPVKFELIEE